ncbi:MAG: elongation factor G [Candidatus Sedimenticola endophacoides]
MAKQHDLGKIRNIGIAAHIDAGKTTLTERILFYTGALYKIGEVHDGAAHMDYMAEEQNHGITITSALTKARWGEHLIQIIDTPGHVDFTIEVERSMRVLDGCVIVLDAVRGVEPQTETVWRQRSKFSLPSLFFINKVDRLGADYDKSLRSIAKRLGALPVPVTVPLSEQHAVVHLIERQLIRFDGEHGEVLSTEPCPDATWAEMAEHHESLLMGIAESDEALADQILAGKEPEPETLWEVLRAGCLSGQLCPCFGGSALRNLGVHPLLDGIVRLLPSPLDRPPTRGYLEDGSPTQVVMEDQGALAALVFKVQMWEGRRHVFARIYRGQLKPGDSVLHRSAAGAPVQEHVARMFDVDAAKKSRIDLAHAGDIVLLAGLRRAATGDTLYAPDQPPLLLERIDAREPVLSLAIEPASSADEEKFVEVLSKLQEEDPTLRFGENPETGQRLISGMGELHLQIIVERLEREYSLSVRTGKPAVALRETILAEAARDLLFQPPIESSQKSAEMKARVKLHILPRPRGGGNLSVIEPRTLPEGHRLGEEQIAALRQGIEFALAGGPIEGAPLQDIETRIEEVEFFGASTSGEALSAATARALRKAIDAASPALLQPVMRTEVVVPDENLGTVLGDLQARHALIQDTAHETGQATIHCEIALAQLLGYTTVLRSMTQGRGQYSTLFERFDTA